MCSFSPAYRELFRGELLAQAPRPHHVPAFYAVATNADGDEARVFVRGPLRASDEQHCRRIEAALACARLKRLLLLDAVPTAVVAATIGVDAHEPRLFVVTPDLCNADTVGTAELLPSDVVALPAAASRSAVVFRKRSAALRPLDAADYAAYSARTCVRVCVELAFRYVFGVNVATADDVLVDAATERVVGVGEHDVARFDATTDHLFADTATCADAAAHFASSLLRPSVCAEFARRLDAWRILLLHDTEIPAVLERHTARVASALHRLDALLDFVHGRHGRHATAHPLHSRRT